MERVGGIWLPSTAQIAALAQDRRRWNGLLAALERRSPPRARRYLETHALAYGLDTISGGAISASNLDANFTASPTTSNNVFGGASLTIASGAIVVVSVVTNKGASTNPDTPTFSGAGQTWTQVSDFLWQTTGTQRRRTTLFRTYAPSGAAGICSINYGVAPANIAWSVDQFTGTDTSGTNGSGAFGTPVTTTADAAAATSGSVTLAALQDANSIAFGAWSHVVASGEQITPGSGFTELADVGTTNANPAQLETEWKLNTTTVNASWATSALFGGIGVEIKMAAAGAAATQQLLALLGIGS